MSEIELIGKCGCGKPNRYQVPNNQLACNKHLRCPTYDEAVNMLIQARQENALMREVLDSIANPIRVMQEEAEKKGARLDGMMAMSLANDAKWLSQQAREVLDKVKSDE
jgi:hypothetical protein